MTAYNFQARFADDVEAGRKTQTIRAPRKDGRHVKPGDKIQLYTGMRTKACRKLGEATCVSVEPILISWDRIVIDGGVKNFRFSGLDDFARADGFGFWEPMAQWFQGTHGLPFEGVLIRWRLDGEPAP